MLSQLRADLRFLLGHHALALLAVGIVAFQVMFLVATAHGARAEVRKQFDVAVPGGTYGELMRRALDGRDPVAESDAVLSAMFGLLVLLNAASAGVIVLNTMLLVVEQRRPVIGRSRALGATRGEIQGQFMLVAGLACTATAPPAFALVWLAAQWLNATNVLHIFLAVGPELLALTLGLLGTAGLLGGWLPARAAARVDPWEMLRPTGSGLSRLAVQTSVVVASFWLAVLLVGLGTGVRETILGLVREMPITDQATIDVLFGKVNESMTSFRLILLLLPVINCFGVLGSIMHLAAYAGRHQLALSRALGETRGQQRLRLLARAVRLSVLSWALGSALALTGAATLGPRWLPFPLDVPPWGLLLSIGVSGLIGLVGGLGPAAAAVRADPAELMKGP